MLSPAVRAAAQTYAESQGTPVVAAVAQGYLTGYCAGVRAPRTARFPLAGDQAFKRLLGAYLAENIDIYHPATNRYGRLLGLPACYSYDGGPFADVEFYADEEARTEGGGDLIEPYGKILPCLYAFEDLASEIVLADGRRVVPAVEVAKLWDMAGASGTAKVLEILNGDYIGRYSHSVELQLGDILNAINLLRRHHFAVGLRPDQYHRKPVASPAAQPHNCELSGCANLVDEAGPCVGCAGKEACPNG